MIDMDKLFTEIRDDEGSRSWKYLCSELHPTTGVGHRVRDSDPEAALEIFDVFADDVPEDQCISDERIRELFETENKKLSWEDQIPESMVESWKLLVSEAVVSDGIFFPRCVRPNHAIGQPLVVCFADGAFPGFSACTYLQWKYSCSHGYTECDNDYDAQLLIAKARVTPISGHTVPRSELAET